MNPTDPLAVFSLIAGPALLTNACSVLLMGTVNRYARALDRTRALRTLAREAAGDQAALIARQLTLADRRVRAILRSMMSFYMAVGSFGLATLAFILHAALAVQIGAWFANAMTAASLGATILGVSGLLFGAANLAWEGRLSFLILRDEAHMHRITAPK